MKRSIPILDMSPEDQQRYVQEERDKYNKAKLSASERMAKRGLAFDMPCKYKDNYYYLRDIEPTPIEGSVYYFLFPVYETKGSRIQYLDEQEFANVTPCDDPSIPMWVEPEYVPRPDGDDLIKLLYGK